jgi:hypothetical protein
MFAKSLRPFNAAVPDLLLFLPGPFSRCNIFTRQMDNSVNATDKSRIPVTTIRFPGNVIVLWIFT